MLDLLREHSRSWLIWAIFIVLILVFIFFFGPQTEGFAPGGRTWAVRTTVDTIYDTQLHHAIQRIEDRTGRRVRLDDAEYAREMERVALDMAAIRVLAERARDAGLSLGEHEVMCYVTNWNRDFLQEGEAVCERFGPEKERLFPNFDFPFYSTPDGSFAPDFRARVRASFAMSVEEYQIHKENELLALMYLQLIARSLSPPPTALREMWNRRQTEASLETIALAIDPDSLPVSEAEISAYATDQSDAIAAFHTLHGDRFQTEREVVLQRVFLRKPMDDEDGAAAVRSRAEALLQRAEEGEDFDEIVRAETELDGERERDGRMTRRSADELDSAMREAIQDLSEGDFALVEQRTSLSVVRLLEDTPARDLPLDEVRLEIAEELLRAERSDALQSELTSLASELIESARSGDISLAEALEALREEGTERQQELAALIEARTSDGFARERAAQTFDHLGPEFAGFTLPAPPADEVPGVGTSAEMVRLAFSLDVGAIHEEHVEVDGVAHIVRLASRTDAPEPGGEAWGTLQREMQRAMADEIIDFDNTRLRLLLHAEGTQLGPYAAAALEHAIARRDVRLRTRLFDVDPATIED